MLKENVFLVCSKFHSYTYKQQELLKMAEENNLKLILFFYYFPFVHTPQGMGTVVQVYFFIAFVFLIFFLKRLTSLIISKFKHPLKKTKK